MSESFFKKFNKIYYNDYAVVDITQRTKFLDVIQKNPYLFYPYDLDDYERPDQIADRYYNDSYLSWMIFYSNNIIDPYYQWYLTNNDFNEFLVKKYGTIEKAASKVVHYTNNWFDDPEQISVTTFNELDYVSQRYYQQVYGIRNNVVAYERKKVDNIRNTNKIIKYTANGANFVRDEVVRIVFDINNSGRGQVVSSNSTVINVQHMMNTVLPNTEVVITGSSYIYGTESESNVAFTSANLLAENISNVEARFWAPVTYYDIENEINQKNKSIRVMDRSYAVQVSRELDALLEAP